MTISSKFIQKHGKVLPGYEHDAARAKELAQKLERLNNMCRRRNGMNLDRGRAERLSRGHALRPQGSPLPQPLAEIRPARPARGGYNHAA